MNATRLDEWDALLNWLMRGWEYGFYWKSEGRTSLWWKTNEPAPLPTTPHNWYFGVHPVHTIPTLNIKGLPADPEYVRSQIEHIAAINCLFADVDGEKLGNKSAALSYVNTFTPTPTAVIDSGGGYHCYWLLNTPVPVTDKNREYLSRVQYRWVNFVKSDGGAKDMARVLRLPGTFNRKPQYPQPLPIRLLRVFWDKTYNLVELTSKLPPDTEPTAASRALQRLQENQKQQQLDIPADDATLLDKARNARNGAKFAALYDRGDIAGYKSQSEADAALCALLNYWTGNDAARVDRLFRRSALFRVDKWDSVRVKGATYGAATITRMARP